MDHKRFEELLAGYFDKTLHEKEWQEFQQILRKYPQARQSLVETAHMEVDLATLLGTKLPSLPSKPQNNKRKMWLSVAVAASLLIGWFIFSMYQPVNVEESIYIVTPEGKQIARKQFTYHNGYVIAPKGSKVLLGKTEGKFLAPAIFKTQKYLTKSGRYAIELQAGQAQFTSPKGAQGVEVTTPVGRLENLGTDFLIELTKAIKEKEMVKKWTSGKLQIFVTVMVFTGLIHFYGDADEKGKFQINPKMGKVALAKDGSIGKVVDREGLASLKPVMGKRWSLAEEEMHLLPGDFVKTGKRGANAIQLSLNNNTKVILGPGALVELVHPSKIKLLAGEIEINAPPKVTVEILGPQKQKVDIQGQKTVRTHKNNLSILKYQPKWLTGYKNNSSTEALGSLLAQVDGRNVPLTIGYHKVNVDIRDQIARTTIEESFVNHTHSVLEGVFYFPLPQDSSISGFGMWIGNEYVHGEIVEKERAREIYEQILRERRDPALLEWTGGNIFKARIFPIGSEKRIKISYTQVLPKTKGSYRYHYALESEMLKQQPLKKLQLDVKIHSATPLAKVECISHQTRIETTKHASHIEFAAEEYTPDRDFEVHISPQKMNTNIVSIAHRRDNDGYFMLLVDAPELEQKNKRDLLTNSKPIDLLIMADTSGSMNGSPRKAQLQFIEALIGSLGEQDRFNIMTCDVKSNWLFSRLQKSSLEVKERALRFIENRHPLGWSDLRNAFRQTMRRATENTHVVYVGDGIITSQNSDPSSFARELKRRYQNAGTFHAVAPGSSYESVVLKAISRLGGGSMHLLGEKDPAQAAFELFKEISSPTVKNLAVDFSGLATAAVYPQTLPNLKADTQQVILGRYDPDLVSETGKVTIRGELGEEKIAYQATIS